MAPKPPQNYDELVKNKTPAFALIPTNPATTQLFNQAINSQDRTGIASSNLWLNILRLVFPLSERYSINLVPGPTFSRGPDHHVVEVWDHNSAEMRLVMTVHCFPKVWERDGIKSLRSRRDPEKVVREYWIARNEWRVYSVIVEGGEWVFRQGSKKLRVGLGSSDDHEVDEEQDATKPELEVQELEWTVIDARCFRVEQNEDVLMGEFEYADSWLALVKVMPHCELLALAESPTKV